MKLRSTFDLFLLVLAMVLIVIVGYGLFMRGSQPTASNTAVVAANDSASASTEDASISGSFGLGGTPGQGDESATLQQIDQPSEASQSWDLVNGMFAVVRATMNVNVRTGPGLTYAVIRSIPRNTEVQVLRRSNDHTWIRVLLSDGVEGWIFGQLLEIRQ